MAELLRLNLYGSVLIIAALGIRKLLFSKLPKQAFYYAWIAVMGFYVLGAVSDRIVKKIPFLDSGRLAAVLPFHVYMKRRVMIEEREGNGFTFIWLAGILFFTLYFILEYQSQVKKFQRGVLLENKVVKEWKRKHGIKRPLDILVLKGLETPLTYGLWKSHILLPEKIDFYSKEFIYVLNHEYIHIKRRDPFYKILFVMLACINWFNPFLWLMLFTVNQDMELSCDEKVLEMMGSRHRKEYALLLLSLGAKRQGAVFPGFGFSGEFIKKRILCLINYKKKDKKRVFFTSFFCGAFAAASIVFICVMNIEYNELLPALWRKAETASWEKQRITDLAEDLKRSGVTSEEIEGMELWENEKGQMIGAFELKPELVAVLTTDGKQGYAYYKELFEQPDFKTPQEALAWQEERQQKREVEHIPVYMEDGETVIGYCVK